MVRTPLGPRTRAVPDHGPRVYQLTLGPVRLTLRPEDFAGLAALLQGGAGAAGAVPPSGAARLRLWAYVRATARGWGRRAFFMAQNDRSCHQRRGSWHIQRGGKLEIAGYDGDALTGPTPGCRQQKS